jgi:hypothetical protein
VVDNVGTRRAVARFPIAKADLRSLRHLARQRQKLGSMLASNKNRLHKLLTGAGIRLGVAAYELHGQSARSMVKAIIAGKSVPEVLSLASNHLRVSREVVAALAVGRWLQMLVKHGFVLKSDISKLHKHRSKRRAIVSNLGDQSLLQPLV